MKNLILIGFMGTGKTTIGNIIANINNMEFIDIDSKIEENENMSISEIFEIKGEVYFRNKEVELLKEVIETENKIISTGGGIIERNENIELLKQENNVVWLNANTETIFKNIYKELENRPKLNKEKDVKLSIEKLLEKRYQMYEEVANIIIDINNKNIDEVVSDILVYID